MFNDAPLTPAARPDSTLTPLHTPTPAVPLPFHVDPLFGTTHVADGHLQALRGTATTSLAMLAMLPTDAQSADPRHAPAMALQAAITMLTRLGKLDPAAAVTLQRIATDPTISAQRLVFISEALSHIGKPYNWGSTGPKQFDCSGLTSSCMKNALGIQIPRTAAYQAKSGAPVKNTDLKAGDLLYFGGSRITHTAIYLGDGLMLEAGGEGRVRSDKGSVRIRPIREDYKTARRYIADTAMVIPKTPWQQSVAAAFLDHRAVQGVLNWLKW